MGYGVEFPLSRLGKAKILWVFRVYGLPGVWVRRVSTVSRRRRTAPPWHHEAVPATIRKSSRRARRRQPRRTTYTSRSGRSTTAPRVPAWAHDRACLRMQRQASGAIYLTISRAYTVHIGASGLCLGPALHHRNLSVWLSKVHSPYTIISENAWARLPTSRTLERSPGRRASSRTGLRA
ncbi:hypothetical protein BD309DRAFT_1024940 [Dichomitus squalens]|nr:hypothetical protein BD309DRAFT_1024940 [Dichomitus squalens]